MRQAGNTQDKMGTNGWLQQRKNIAEYDKRRNETETAGPKVGKHGEPDRKTHTISAKTSSSWCFICPLGRLWPEFVGLSVLSMPWLMHNPLPETQGAFVLLDIYLSALCQSYSKPIYCSSAIMLAGHNGFGSCAEMRSVWLSSTEKQRDYAESGESLPAVREEATTNKMLVWTHSPAKQTQEVSFTVNVLNVFPHAAEKTADVQAYTHTKQSCYKHFYMEVKLTASLSTWALPH